MGAAIKLIFDGKLTEKEVEKAYKFFYRSLIVSLTISIITILI